MVSLEFREIFCLSTENGIACVRSPFLNQSKMNSGSDNDNSSSSSDESEDSDSLSNASDEELENLFDSDDDEDDFAGFGVDLPDDIHWGNVRFQPAIDQFRLTPGPAINLPDSGRALDFFLLFFDNELIEQIVRFTNANAVVKGARNWQAVTSEEMKVFLAFLIISNDLVVVPRDEQYFLSTWNTKIFHTSNIRNLFSSRKRLFQLKKYIYFVDPRHVLTEDERKDHLFKIRNVSSSVINKCRTLFNCGREVSVDEAMIPFKGRLSIKVRMPDKPVKFGVKFFVLCDAKSGYCKNVIIYAGKDDRAAGNLGKTGKIVMELMQDLYRTNHYLYMDNFYTSPILFRLLKARGILAAGTARPRQGYPSNELKAAQLRSRGQVAWLSWNEMLALRWKDRKDVFFLSTIHAPPEVPNWVDTGTAPDSDPDAPEEEDPTIVRRRVRVRGQWQSQKIYRPPIVADYNRYMGGVDLCDQMTRVNKSKKQQRWYMRVFIKFLLLAIYNAYILEGYEIPHNGRGKRKRDLLKFKQDLCVQLVGTTPTRNKAAKRQRQNMPPEDRLENVGSHLPLKGVGNDHRCVVCEKKYTEAKKTGETLKRHKTSYKCGQCNVYLCIGLPGESCFVDYHTKTDYWK